MNDEIVMKAIETIEAQLKIIRGELSKGDPVHYRNYIIMHKPFPVEQDDLYKGLCVGGLKIDGMRCESEGKNIGEYNDRINELTGLYYIWKNTVSNFVGMCHYRRFFSNGRYDGDMSRLDSERIQEIFLGHGYDIILPELRLKHSLFSNIADCIGHEMNSRTFETFCSVIMKKQPQYLPAFLDVMQGDRAYFKNMFVTKRKIMDEYCEWLFSFILDVADAMDFTGCSEVQKRSVGYYAEYFWTVWLRSQNYKVLTLPYIVAGEQDGELVYDMGYGQ